MGEASHPGPPKSIDGLGEESIWCEVPTAPTTSGAGTPRRRRLRLVGSGFTPTLVNTPVVRHANRLSPLSAEINDEPGVPNAFGVPQVVHPPGESDTDSVEFHAIHTPAGSDSGEEGDDDISGHSEPEEEEVVGTFDPHYEDIVPIGVDVARAAMARGFRSLDQITLDTEFRSRGCLMRVVPKIMRGIVRTAFRLSFQEGRSPRSR